MMNVFGRVIDCKIEFIIRKTKIAFKTLPVKKPRHKCRG